MIALLGRTDAFPALERALRRPDGLLAAGADLSPGRLLDAYGRGIFPWFGPGEPILWWSPDPRMVLLPGELRVTRSLHKVLRNRPWEVRFDTAFRQVMEACAAPREGQPGTWIVPEMIEAYCQLHALGWAHSVEAWIDGKLAGGLYGIALGGVFFGESMFARVRDASKVALVHLVRALEADGFGLIDCQMATAHLASLGARQIPRREFARRLEELINSRQPVVPWIPARPPK